MKMTKGMKNVPLLLAIALAAGACAHQKMSATTKTVSGGANAPLALSAQWVKTKGEKTDMMVQITNNTKKDIEIDTADFECYRGSDKANFRHSFGSPYRLGVIVLPAEQSRTDLVYCNFGAKGAGNFTLKVEKVFESHDGDDEKRKVLAKNLAWEIATTSAEAK